MIRTAETGLVASVAEMVRPISTTEVLLNMYGPLMTLVDLAAVLRRSVDGLRVSLPKRDPFYCALSAAKVRLGRRTYFSTASIAQILSDRMEGAGGRDD